MATVKGEYDELNRQARDIWEKNAAWWDERAGDSDLPLQRLLIGPATERLLDLKPGEVVLDVACGNGGFSRHMAQLGAHVLAIDTSPTFIEKAKARSAQYGDQIEYRIVDAASESELLALVERRFDAAVCTMAIMDMAAIEPLMSALTRLLKPGGRFVFSVTHPCFNSTGIRRLAEEEDQGDQIVETFSIKVVRYLGLQPTRGLGIIGQPEPQIYFDRPLHVLFNTCFRAGMVMDGLEEPGFEPDAEARRWFSWENFKEIPPVLLVRMRVPGGGV